MSLLPLIIAIPILGALLCLLAGRIHGRAAQIASSVAAGFGLMVSLILFALVRSQGTLSIEAPWIPQIGSSLSLLADGLSAPLVVLTSLLLLVATLVARSEISERQPMFHACLHAAAAGIQIVFLSRDAFLFYFGYELMLIPIFLIIGSWGHENRAFAAMRFLLFTFGGSIFLLGSILFLHSQHLALEGVRSFAIDDLARTAARLPLSTQCWVYLGIVLGFGVKIPLFPLHTWLPETYTQSPTAGNILLAGIMSKTGLYGLLRLGQPFAPAAAIEWAPYLIFLAVVSIFVAAWAAFAQRDIKRVIAYSSISHLGMATVGILISAGSGSAGLQGALFIMVAHGLSTAGLFLIAGLVHRHARTRELEAYGGLWNQAPVLGGFFLFFSLASLGLPGTANFVGEIYVIAESFRQNPALGALLAVAVVFAAAYSLRLFILTMHGPASSRVKSLPDASNEDSSVLGVLTALLLIIGFAPAIISGPKSPVVEVKAAQLREAPDFRMKTFDPAVTVIQTQRSAPNSLSTTATMTNREATQ